jgi:hypothetical protein
VLWHTRVIEWASLLFPEGSYPQVFNLDPPTDVAAGEPAVLDLDIDQSLWVLVLNLSHYLSFVCFNPRPRDGRHNESLHMNEMNLRLFQSTPVRLSFSLSVQRLYDPLLILSPYVK